MFACAVDISDKWAASVNNTKKKIFYRLPFLLEMESFWIEHWLPCMEYLKLIQEIAVLYTVQYNYSNFCNWCGYREHQWGKDFQKYDREPLTVKYSSKKENTSIKISWYCPFKKSWVIESVRNLAPPAPSSPIKKICLHH